MSTFWTGLHFTSSPPFARTTPDPHKAPYPRPHQPPEDKPGKPAFVPSRPKAAFQWPTDCLWSFTDTIRYH